MDNHEIDHHDSEQSDHQEDAADDVSRALTKRVPGRPDRSVRFARQCGIQCWIDPPAAGRQHISD
jgi:hypothetical protein